uniref:Putative adaptor protein shc n=1 Tax=Lutzomyia longipalpis TaxID=7200 RepID=A0A1B0CEK1_LUTLO
MPRNYEASGEFSKSRGLLQNEQALLSEGLTFNVRYIGCLEIKTSMKTLEFTTRSLVAKECINRVCEAAGLKASRKRRVDKKIIQCISDKPIMENAGANVTLTVSSKFLSLTNIDTGEVIANNDMPRISFASGGDTDTLDFVAYVAKDLKEWRACYVLECGGGQAQDLIATIGLAFEEYKNVKDSPYNLRCDKDYYNDLPGKVPPDLLFDGDLAQSLSHLNVKTSHDRMSTNLIDLNSPTLEHDYVNENRQPAATEATASTSFQTRDLFDMQPFSLSAEVQRSQLITESWFHGAISRPVSENLLKSDGDFLVRESQGTPGQYVLTGMQSSSPKHLLLIDPEGVVRTKDRIFESISHLINYHWTNSLPIISAESALVLRTPIMRTYEIKMTK